MQEMIQSEYTLHKGVLQKRVSDLFLSSPGVILREKEKESFERWIHERFHALRFEAEWVDYDPYPDHESMRIDFVATKRLKISAKHNESIFNPVTNLMFRAVHDIDHCRLSLPFTFAGERDAARAVMSACGDALGRQVLFSEIVAQAAVVTTTRQYAKQKFVAFPLPLIDAVIFEREPSFASRDE